VLTGEDAGAVAVVPVSRGGEPTGVHEVAGRKVFLEVLAPPPHLVVCGGGDDARPLVAYAADAGFRVSLFDHRPALLAPEWFPQAARLEVARPEDPQVVLPPAERSLAVVKTHSLAHDRAWVRRLLAAGLAYVGVLGPRARTDSILQEVLAGQRLTGDERERVFGPVGLDLGADGPRQVAISIVAELLAFTARREPRHLSERPEAIHAG
jgi:xanthine/CO dehydrogenase XdhC/CoxF family maturation factor